MPVSPDDTSTLARSVSAVYESVERVLLERLAHEVGSGLDSPQWVADKQQAVSRVREWARRLLEQATSDAQDAAERAVRESTYLGVNAAVTDLAEATGQAAGTLRDQLNIAALARLAVAALGEALPETLAVLRTVVDAFRQIVAETAGTVIAGVETRRQAAQRALWRAAERGITGFVDRSGRRWELASWAEMSLRTATARAMLDAHAASLDQLGVHLVVVSDAPQECRLCRPWEGRVLALPGDTGGVGVRTLPSEIGGPPVRVRVAGSLVDARAAGLFHPNCRHSTAAYIPGVTTRPPRSTADRQGDEDRQHLRYLERQVRVWKKREAASLDPAAARRAREKVRHYQARIRSHVDSTSVMRQRHREQIGRAR